MIIVITGGSAGIGRATAEFLADKGHKVYSLARSKIESEKFSSIQCDITNFENATAALGEIYQKEGKIDVLINNAGMGIAGAIEQTSFEDIEKIFSLNVFALINMCKAIVPFMRNGGGGKIINIGSVAGVIPIPFQTCYSATKAAVDMFTMAFGLEVRDFNIHLTTIMPGDTKTSFTASRVKNAVVEKSPYKGRIEKSIEKMEKDEQCGKSPLSVSKVIYKVIKKKRPPKSKTVGISYKAIVLLEKILPRKFMLWVVKKMYG